MSFLAFSQSDEDKEFIELYIKIQSLEKEIASLRNQIEILETQVQFYQGKNIELIDEIDSVLIDEARTPLILSAFKDTENINKLYLAKAVANLL